MGTAETGKAALEYGRLTDQQRFDTILLFNTDGPILELRFQVVLPQVGRLHHMGIAIDNDHRMAPANNTRRIIAAFVAAFAPCTAIVVNRSRGTLSLPEYMVYPALQTTCTTSR